MHTRANPTALHSMLHTRDSAANRRCRNPNTIDTDVLLQVKEVNPNVSTVFYYNSVLDFPQYV